MGVSMDPLTINDLYVIIGQQQAQILQLQRHVEKLRAPELPELEAPNGPLTAEVIPAPT